MTNNDLFFLMKVQYQDLEESLEKYLEEVDAGNTFLPNFMDRDCGTCAIKRKIIAIRQTLMRIEKGI